MESRSHQGREKGKLEAQGEENRKIGVNLGAERGSRGNLGERNPGSWTNAAVASHL